MFIQSALIAPLFTIFTYFLFRNLIGIPIYGPTSLDPRLLLASKVTYQHRTPFADAPELADVGTPKGCTPKFLYLVSRHGSRWATTKRWKQMKALEPILTGAPNEKDHPWLQDWKLPFTDHEGNLHPIGSEELYDLAKRLQAHFPDILGQPYSPLRYHFQSTEKQRTIDSATAFASGLFDSCLKDDVRIHRAPIANDTLLRFYDVNSTYDEEASAREDAVAAWADSAIYPPLASKIEFELGYSTGELDENLFDSVWTLCQMQAALQDEVDEACSLISNEAFLDANWVSDTETFQRTGLTIDDHCLIAKPLASDLLHWLKVAADPHKLAEQTSGQLARLHFGHRETIVPLFCILGIGNQTANFEDEPREPPPFSVLTQDINSRFWRDTRIAPMAGNFLAVLYDCGSDMRVRFVWNEQIVSGDWCNGTECQLADVVDRLEKRMGTQ